MKLEGLTKFGRFLVSIKCFHAYGLKGSNKLGGFIWRWWNPISWVLAPLAFITYGVLEGFPEAWKCKYDIGFGINPWYKDKELDWK